MSCLADCTLTPSMLVPFSCLPPVFFLPFLLCLPLLISECSLFTRFFFFIFFFSYLIEFLSLLNLVRVERDIFDKVFIVLIEKAIFMISQVRNQLSLTLLLHFLL